MILCMLLGFLTTDITSATLMAVDFGINIYLTLRLVWINKKQPLAIEKQNEFLQDLVLNELVEFLGPTIFLLLLFASYFGPNHDLLTMVRFLKTQEALKSYMGNVFLFFFVDFCSTIISGIILWVFCKINLFKVYLRSQKELWWIMASQEAYLLYEVSISSLVESCYVCYSFILF